MGGGGSGAKLKSRCGCEVADELVAEDTLKEMKEMVNFIHSSSQQDFPFGETEK